MNNQETVTCPFCGAPYSEAIPTNLAHVNCNYCKSAILLPSNLSVVPRCPNHADTIAIGLCNDCMQAFCKSCLHFRRRGREKTHLCTKCLSNRQTEEIQVMATGMIAFGIIAFLISLIVLQSSISMFLFFFLFLSLPFTAGGLYFYLRAKHASQAATVPTLQRLKEEKEKLSTTPFETESLYWMLVKEYAKISGVAGLTILEKRIHDYMNQGLTLNEAIGRLAKIEKII